MISGLPAEVLLAAGYAIFLVAMAAVLERLARHSHRRSESFHVTGFKYLQGLDVWVCPTGQELRRSQIDHGRRLVRYQAPSHACNSCRTKISCTDSDAGRAIERHLDSWLDSEIRRFHRGISLALLLLAALVLLAETARHHRLKELIVLWSLLAAIGRTGAQLLSAFLARQMS